MKMALEMSSAWGFTAVGKLLRTAFQLLSLTFCNGMLYVCLCLFQYTGMSESGLMSISTINSATRTGLPVRLEKLPLHPINFDPDYIYE